MERESLFFHSESAAAHLSAFEQAVEDGIITAEGGWKEADALEAAAREAATVLGPDGTEAAIASAASWAAAAAAEAAASPAPASKRGRGSRGGRGGRGKSRGRGRTSTPSGPRSVSPPPSTARRGRSGSRARGKRKRSSRSVSPTISLPSSGDEFSSASDDLSGLDGAEAKALLASRGLYEVDRLVGDVWEGGLHWFRVKWRGYDEYENSWQRPEDLSGCDKEIEAYWARKKAKQESAAKAERSEKRKAKERTKRNQLVRQAGYTPAQADAMGAFTVEQWTTMHAQLLKQKAAAAASTAPPASALSVDLATMGPWTPAVAASATTPAAASSPAAAAAGTAGPNPASSPPPRAVLLSPDGDDWCVYPLHTFKTLAQAQQNQEDESDDERTPPAASLPPRHSPDYEADVADDTASTCSTSSTASLLCHPAHKHAHDRAQCILAHDWYEQQHDQSTWLMLVKWKLKPVAGHNTEE